MSISTHGMSLADMRELVYFLADETPGNPVFPVHMVDRLIHNGLSRISAVIGDPVVTLSTNTKNGVSDYPLVDPIMVDGYPEVFSVSVNGMELRYTNDSLTQYTITRLGVHLVTMPTAIDPPDVLSVTYRKEADLNAVDSADSTETISYQGAEAACIYAVWQMKMKDDEYNAADRWKQRFDESLSWLAGPQPGVYKPSATATS